MRQSVPTGEHLFRFDSPSVRAFFHARHPHKTAAHLAAAAGATQRAAQKWLSGEAEPSGPTALRLVDHYGPELAAVLMPRCAWARQAARAARHAALRGQLDALQGELAALDAAAEARA